MSNSRERIAKWENGLLESRERIAIRENRLSYLTERFNNQWERILNPRERIAQFEMTVFFCLILKISMFLVDLRTFKKSFVKRHQLFKGLCVLFMYLSRTFRSYRDAPSEPTGFLSITSLHPVGALRAMCLIHMNIHDLSTTNRYTL